MRIGADLLPGFGSDCLDGAHDHCPALVLLYPVIYLSETNAIWIRLRIVTRDAARQMVPSICRAHYDRKTYRPLLTALSNIITPPLRVSLRHSSQYSIICSLLASTKHTSYPGLASPSSSPGSLANGPFGLRRISSAGPMCTAGKGKRSASRKFC